MRGVFTAFIVDEDWIVRTTKLDNYSNSILHFLTHHSHMLEFAACIQEGVSDAYVCDYGDETVDLN